MLSVLITEKMQHLLSDIIESLTELLKSHCVQHISVSFTLDLLQQNTAELQWYFSSFCEGHGQGYHFNQGQG